MTFKIDPNRLMVPKGADLSSGYAEAQKRFQEILSSKLGVNSGTNQITPAELTAAMAKSNFVASDVTAGNYQVAQRIDEKLKGTPMAGLGEKFVQAGQKYGINPLFLASLGIHESNYGKSQIAQDKNNLFGFKAYDRSPYASAEAYGSFSEGIDRVAAYLKTAYLTPGAKYYNGLGVTDIGKRYATDPQWAKSIERLAQSF